VLHAAPYGRAFALKPFGDNQGTTAANSVRPQNAIDPGQIINRWEDDSVTNLVTEMATSETWKGVEFQAALLLRNIFKRK
jgi:hypothetical protein